MAQLNAVTGLSGLKRNQVAELNARLPFLTTILSQQSQKKFQDAQLASMTSQEEIDRANLELEKKKFGLSEQQYGLEERGLGLQERGLGIQQKGYELEQGKLAQSEREFGWQKTQADKARELQKMTEQREMGVKAAGLGFTALGSGLGSKMTTLGDITSGVKNLWSGLTKPEGTYEKSVASKEGLSGLNVSAIAGGGLLGFGAGQAFGGKNKLTKTALGAGVGGVASLLGSGGDWGSAIGGGLLGGLGGLL